jgi:diguanylate cyclase (GGDEF)-like protein
VTPAFEASVTFAPRLVPQLPKLPAWMRRFVDPANLVPKQFIDRSTGLYNRAGLFAVAHGLIRERAADVPVSVIVVDFADLREVCDIYGTSIARKVVAKAVRRLRKVAGWHGIVGRTGPSQFTVVLPGASEDKALRQLQRGLGKPARVEFDAGDSEIVLVPDFVVDVLEAGADKVHDVYREMCRDLARLQSEEQRRLHWLASERARHSRPMSLPR